MMLYQHAVVWGGPDTFFGGERGALKSACRTQYELRTTKNISVICKMICIGRNQPDIYESLSKKI